MLRDIAYHSMDPGPARAWVAVSGEVAPGKGGPWRTDDDGATWIWVGAGLPTTVRLFRSEIWIVGPCPATGEAKTATRPGNRQIIVSGDRSENIITVGVGFRFKGQRPA